MTEQIFLARQPIFDRDGRTFGYELFNRTGPDNAAAFDDEEHASVTVVEHVVLEWGMERLIGDRFGFVNADPAFVVAGLHRTLPPEGIVIELSNARPLDDRAMGAIERALREGYHFALDNVTEWSALSGSPALDLVSLVKVDITAPRAELELIAAQTRAVRPDVLLVAEKVETQRQYGMCREIGFDLFQGYFFARPELMNRTARPANAATILTLLTEIQDPDVDIARVEELVGSDATMAYRLLAVVNSSAFGLDRRAESLRHAIVLLGLSQVRNVAVLLALSSPRASSEELITVGATRARLASQIALDPDLRSSAFTVGVLSVTDSLYGTPMTVLLDDLPVSQSIKDALLERSGPLGEILELVMACEIANVEAITRLAPGRVEELQVAYQDAVAWADAVRSQVASSRSDVSLPSLARSSTGWSGGGTPLTV